MGQLWSKYFRGALDIIVVEQPDKTFKCSGWYLRYNSSCNIKKTSVVEIAINSRVVNFPITYGQFGKDKNGVPTYPRDSDNLAPIFEGLREGKNDITFSIKGREDLKPVDARIFRWKWDSKVVVMDVDGTMTKSEIWGLFYSFAEINYLRKGVASLSSAVERYGYQHIYLTARPIPWMKKTRRYLSAHRDEKDHRIKLPEGPVITSCHGVFRTGWSHFTWTSRAAFKIPCLRKIKGLFPMHTKPFYAGFGDKKSDLRSYQAVGIPEGRIFYIKKRAIVIYKRKKEFIRFVRGYEALQAICFNMIPCRKPSGYDKVDQDEGNLRESFLESIRSIFPRVSQLPRDSDSHRGERDMGRNGSAQLRRRPRQT